MAFQDLLLPNLGTDLAIIMLSIIYELNFSLQGCNIQLISDCTVFKKGSFPFCGQTVPGIWWVFSEYK